MRQRKKRRLGGLKGKVLRDYVDGDKPVYDALKKHNVPRSEFWDWIDGDARFRREYLRARVVIATSQQKTPRVRVRAEREFLEREELEERKEGVFSEREWVRSMSGEEGVKAYDELAALKEARRKREEALEGAEKESKGE